MKRAEALHLIITLSLIIECIVNAAPAGMISFFKSNSCPTGWTEFAQARGRLVVSVIDESAVGLTLGNPLQDLSIPTHSHSVVAQLVVTPKNISAQSGSNYAGAGSGIKYDSIHFGASDSAYPFTHLVLCILTKTDSTPVPPGIVAFFNNRTCPSSWNTFNNSSGRILIPGSSANGIIASKSSPLSSLEDRKHTHTFMSHITINETYYNGSSEGSNLTPAQSGNYTVTGTTEPSGSGFPYIQLLTCISSENGTGRSLPKGILFFYANGNCNNIEIDGMQWGDAGSSVLGHWIIALPENGTANSPFGGLSWKVNSSSHTVHHTHPYSSSVYFGGTGISLNSGCCAGPYAKTGAYLFSDNTYGSDIDMPFLSMPFCQLLAIGSPSATPSSYSLLVTKKKKKGFPWWIILAIVLGVLALCLLLAIIAFLVARNKKKKNEAANKDTVTETELPDR